jgi:FPC/CPF motif-containing protein YcgG
MIFMIMTQGAIAPKRKEPNDMAIITQADLTDPVGDVPEWHRQVVHDLDARLAQSIHFPCTFARNAFARELVRFIFVEDASDAAIEKLAATLLKYVAMSRNWDGKLSTAYPLVVAFSHNAIQSERLEDYHAFGWDVLQRLHLHDPAPWPNEVALDPHSPYWTMCFDGMQIFVNMSCPAHEKRRSRNLGEHLLFIVNPRERFDVVAGASAAGRKVRETIRGRIEAYDNQAHCPQLGSYVIGEIEWWQYGITDTNQDRQDKCPFKVFNEEDA